MIHQSVIDIFPAFTKPLEWDVLWPYQDIKGLVTVGYGCLIEPISSAYPIPWLGDPTDKDIKTEWDKVNAYPAARHYKQYERACSLRIDEETSVALLELRLHDFADWLMRKHFPDWDNWPADAQLAFLAQAWACGPDFPREFSNMKAFALKRDWAGVAKCQKIRTDGNAGIIPRNAHIQLCLANALELDGPDGYATPALYWPGHVAPAVAPDTLPAYKPLSVTLWEAAQRATSRFNVHDDGLTGHAHGPEAA
jgi:hypothetical protein